MEKTGKFNFEEVAAKCMKQAKNRLFFQYRALSPAIYRMPIQYLQPGAGQFGTDSESIYADPMSVIISYKKSPEHLERMYVHMLFHCIYLHPFVEHPKDDGLWNIALDICCEAAVLRLDPADFDGNDARRKTIIKEISSNIMMMLPGLVYKAISEGIQSGAYSIMELTSLFHMDDHLWLNGSSGGASQGTGRGQSDDQGDQRDQGDQENQDDQNDQNDQDENQDNSQSNSQDNNQGDSQSDSQDNSQQPNGSNGSGSNGNGSNGNSSNGNQHQNNSSMDQKKQEWSDVSRKIAADMMSFHSQGTESGNTIQEIDYLTKDKMSYEEFLRQFAIMEEKMMVNMDEFDYMYYTYGLSMPGKKKLLIEPLEYKEEKVVKDFVIAIDTSGSCAGELVQRFLRKTYSILKETESFSSRVNIHIIQCDAKVQMDTKITNMKELETYMQDMQLYGFGGTDFRPVFEYVDTLINEKEFENLCGLIYFTDGYGTYPQKPTPYKTAFAYLEDYKNREDIPSWAMSVFWNEDEDL